MKRSWILLLAVLLGYAPMYLGNKPLCYLNGNCYTVLITELQFTNANMSCGPQGSLTTMKSEQEKKEILQLATDFQYRKNLSEFWIGLHQPGKTCTVKDKNLYGFIWISGEDDTQVNEWEKIPRKSCTTNKRCVALQSNWGPTNSGLGNLTWFWKTYKCAKKLPSICRFPKDFFQSEDVEILSPPPTNQYMEFTSSPIHTTEMIAPTINVLCKEYRGNEIITCKVENIPYSCNDTYCFCGQMDDTGGRYGLRRCQAHMNESCLGQCIRSSNISCVCRDHQTSCDRGECIIITSITAMSPSPVTHDSTSSPLINDDENLFDKLIIPLILGLVALGILIMLIWGGVQMCVRKRKPKRKKSIVPAAEPEASDTDSTENSSSDEEGDSQDRVEMP